MTENNPDNTLLPAVILRDEHSQLRRRREHCFASDHPHRADEATPAHDTYRSTVGLALSGGGIRSASFNLGILEAFQRHGLIRWVDYLSTVSGGGFIGAYFGTKLCKSPEAGGAASPSTDGQPRVRTFELRPQASQIKPQDAGEFIRGGTFLKDKAQVTERFLLGFILNLALFGSFAVAVAAWVAWLWRWLDCPSHCYWMADRLYYLSRYVEAWLTGVPNSHEIDLNM
jgi:hypothetical protein